MKLNEGQLEWKHHFHSAGLSDSLSDRRRRRLVVGFRV